MISFQDIKINKKEAVYPQLAEYIKKKILLNEIEDYAELPSRRELAISLTINPNTVQKAYKMLEDESIIETISNVKSVVRVNEVIQESIRIQLIEQSVKGFTKDCKSNGLTFQSTIALLTKYWEE